MSGPDEGLSDRERWNRRYRQAVAAGPAAERPGLVRRRPSGWLLEQAALLEAQPRGRALDVAGGFGRNAFFLAELGFEVELFDVSDVAVDEVRRQAAARGLAVSAERRDLRGARFSAATYQIVLDIKYLDRSLFPALVETLLPGGLLFLESYLAEHVDDLDNDFNPAYTLQPNELLQAFGDLRVLDYRELVVDVRGGARKAVARLVARREAASAEGTSR